MLARLVIAGATLWVIPLTGCGSGHRSASAPASTPPSSSAPGTSGAGAPVSQPVSASTVSASTVSASTVTGTPVSIPPYLCDATDQAQNAADAYMGALSAGNEKQATACVLPGTVPATVTRGLLATVKGTAVYLPRDGVDGPTLF